MSETFVMGLMGPFEPGPFTEAMEAVAPNVSVVSIPYLESSELRASKGQNNGKDPSGLPVPELFDADLEALTRVHGVVALDLPENMDELAPNLRWWQGLGAGYDQIDTELLARMGVIQTNASGIASIPIAEFVMGRLLQVWKHLRQLDDAQDRRVWEELYGLQMEGRTLGIVGLGAIGRELAVRARAFGMTVLAARGLAKPGDSDPDVDELFPASALDDMLPLCDAVVLALPAGPEVEDLMDARRLALMPQGSVLVNVARGMHVVEADLIAALESGHLGAAVLDVTRQEPLPPDDPLWSAPNIYISPHSAISLDRYEATLIRLAADNLGRLLRDEPLRNVVNDPR